MKKFYYGLNVFLVLAIPLMIFSNFSNKKVDIQKKTQSLNTSVFTEGKKLVEESKVLVDDITDSEKNLFDESLSIMETSVSNSLVTGNIITDVLETQVGTMSSYGPDCVGCSGRLGGGYDARSGNYTYSDEYLDFYKSAYGDDGIKALNNLKYQYISIYILDDKSYNKYKKLIDRIKKI